MPHKPLVKPKATACFFHLETPWLWGSKRSSPRLLLCHHPNDILFSICRRPRELRTGDRESPRSFVSPQGKGGRRHELTGAQPGTESKYLHIRTFQHQH